MIRTLLMIDKQAANRKVSEMNKSLDRTSGCCGFVVTPSTMDLLRVAVSNLNVLPCVSELGTDTFLSTEELIKRFKPLPDMKLFGLPVVVHAGLLESFCLMVAP